MKLLPYILLFTLIGCSRSAGTRMADDLHRWVPTGTPLASARQIMEQHHFTCSVTSYDNASAITNDPDAVQWTKVFVPKHGSGEVRNISVLDCQSDKPGWRHAEWLTINGKTYRLLQWGTTVPKRK